MTDPTPPDDIPEYIQTGLQSQSPKTLRKIAAYATTLAESKEAQQDEEDEDEDEDRVSKPSDDVPDDVPAKASTVIKEINDNRYYYWQWREGHSVKSKYKGPVNADE
jgi:Ni/Co efflux regulator RcnB